MKIAISRWLLVIGSAVALAGCSLGGGKPENVGKPSAGEGEGVEIEDRVGKLSKQFGLTFSDNSRKAILDAVDGSGSSGLATLEGVEKAQLVTVLANLPDLGKKEEYVAQLTGNGKPIMLGALSIAKGGWMLERKVNIDSTVYKTIEILKGEQTILRGSF